MSINIAVGTDRLLITSTESPHELVLLLAQPTGEATINLNLTESFELMKGVAWLLDLEQGDDWCAPTKEYPAPDYEVAVCS